MRNRWAIALLSALPAFSVAEAQRLESDDLKSPIVEAGQTIVSARDWLMAGQFAPIFYHETSSPRAAVVALPPSLKLPADRKEPNPADFITRVNFDDNWIAYDNWQNFESPKADFRASVYFSTVETLTHVFICYTVFHPRDTASIHENDLEGAIVAVEKGDNRHPDRLVYVETLAHNIFYKYYNPDVVDEKPVIPLHEKLLMSGNHPLLYIESRGHGEKRYDDKPSLPGLPPKMFIVYRYKGRAEDPRKVGIENVGFDLIPIYSTLWKSALIDREANATFTDFKDYGEFVVRAAKGSSASGATSGQDGDLIVREKLVNVGSALIGRYGRPNAAHPPWGWSLDGHWFFLPAEEFKKDFHAGEDFSLTYVHHPFLQIFRGRSRP